jgi:hypothetical protein
MKKSIIAAAGGVLAAGFLTVSAPPVAHAVPAEPCNAGWTAPGCLDCVMQYNYSVNCGYYNAHPGVGPPVNQPFICPPSGVAISGQNCQQPGAFKGTPRFAPAAYHTWDWCSPLNLPGYEALHASCEARLQHACAIGDPVCNVPATCPGNLMRQTDGTCGCGQFSYVRSDGQCAVCNAAGEWDADCGMAPQSGFTGRTPRFELTAAEGPLCIWAPGMTPDRMQQCLNMEQNQAQCDHAAGCAGAPPGCPPDIAAKTGMHGPIPGC